MLPRFEAAGRTRPIDLIAPCRIAWREDYPHPAPERRLRGCPQPAPYLSVAAELAGGGPVELTITAPEWSVTARLTENRLGLMTTGPHGPTEHRSRRHGRAAGPVTALALTLTGTQVTGLTREHDGWIGRGRVDLRDLEGSPVLDESALARIQVGFTSPTARVTRLTAGGFGQLGLRDLRVVSHHDGSPVRDGGEILLTATHAGPGFFGTAHTGVWRLDPGSLALRHTADLFFRRPDRPGVYGDHATHLVRTDAGWLVATSTWADFDRRDPRVGTTLAHSTADLTRGVHVLDTVPLSLPPTTDRTVGTWDPHLVWTGSEWLVGYVAASRYFDFHPAVAHGPELHSLTLLGADPRRRATEGTTLIRLDGRWRVLASDGPDGRRGQRRRYPILDHRGGGLVESAVLDAPYPTNLPWPTVLRTDAGWLLIGFDGTPTGGRLLGYGTHGDVVFARA